MNACPALITRAQRRRFRPRIGRGRDFGRAWSASIGLFAYFVMTWHAAGISSSSARG
jgi:hypothetical protein